MPHARQAGILYTEYAVGKRLGEISVIRILADNYNGPFPVYVTPQAAKGGGHHSSLFVSLICMRACHHCQCTVAGTINKGMSLYGKQVLVSLQNHRIDQAIFCLYADQRGIKQKICTAFYHHVVIYPLELFDVYWKFHFRVVGLRPVERIKYFPADSSGHKVYTI